MQTSWWRRVTAKVFSGTRRRSPGEVVAYLSNFIEGEGRPNDWDDFTSVDISDPELEAIRAAAANIYLPVNVDGDRRLRTLLDEARRVEQERRS
ncbi:hypothetical protein [Brevundimonas sp.]|uniref:hypothetical protein n=1 Tax=Brevundimonas sp. TaxID=1871086 RepID=UPI002EDB866E